MKLAFQETVALPAKITARLEGKTLFVKGPKTELSRDFVGGVSIVVEGTTIRLSVPMGSKREKTQFYTTAAHIKNMIRGSQAPFQYKLKIFSSHFPITASVSGTTFAVKNFLGEKIPRTCQIPQGVKVSVAANDIVVESSDVEKAGRTASILEGLTRISDKDRRVFQDGIFITEKVEHQVPG